MCLAEIHGLIVLQLFTFAHKSAGDGQTCLQGLQPVELAMRVAERVREQSGDLAHSRKLSRWSDLVDLGAAEAHQWRLQMKNQRLHQLASPTCSDTHCASTPMVTLSPAWSGIGSIMVATLRLSCVPYMAS